MVECQEDKKKKRYMAPKMFFCQRKKIFTAVDQIRNTLQVVGISASNQLLRDTKCKAFTISCMPLVSLEKTGRTDSILQITSKQSVQFGNNIPQADKSRVILYQNGGKRRM